MPEQTPPSAAEQQRMLEEARQKFDAAKGKLDRQAAKARDAWNARIARLRQELTDVEAVRAGADERRAKLKPLAEDPRAREWYWRMLLLVESQTQLAKMKHREIACYQQCVAQLDAIGPLDTETPAAAPAFPMPVHDLAYLEARSRFDAATLAYHWRHHGVGLDAILRASGQAAMPTPDAETEASHEAAAAALRTATKADKDLAILLGKLGSELDEARALFDWAQSSLRTLGQLPEPARRQALADTDWAKLNAAVQLVMLVPERAQAFPALAKLFPATGSPALT